MIGKSYGHDSMCAGEPSSRTTFQISCILSNQS